MKFRKLNSRGFSHDLLLVAFIVVFAIAGVAYIVASHAETCDAFSTDTACYVTPTQPLAGACKINNVPASLTYGQVVNPSVSFKNTGINAFAPDATIGMSSEIWGEGSKGGPVSAPTLTSGQMITVPSGITYTAQYSTGPNQSIKFTVVSGNPAFSCTASALLPANPNPLTAVACVIDGVPSNPAKGQVLSPSVTLTNKGNQQIAPTGTATLKTFGSSNKTVSSLSNDFSANLLQPGQTTTLKLATYTVPTKSGKAVSGAYAVNGKNVFFNCIASFKLP